MGTFFGNPEVVASFSIALVALLLKTGSRRRLYAFLATMGGGGLLLLALKQYYHRARPASSLTMAHGYSFPSGMPLGHRSLGAMARFRIAQGARERGRGKFRGPPSRALTTRRSLGQNVSTEPRYTDEASVVASSRIMTISPNTALPRPPSSTSGAGPEEKE